MTLNINFKSVAKNLVLALFIAWSLLGGAAGFRLWLQPTGLTYSQSGKRVTRAAALDVLIANEVQRQAPAKK